MRELIYLKEWMKDIPAKTVEESNNSMEKTEYEETKQWWEPYVFVTEYDPDEKVVDWLCDHLGDAQEVMEELWNEILRLRQEK